MCVSVCVVRVLHEGWADFAESALPRTEIQAIKLVLLDGKSPFPNESLVGQGLKDGK